MTWSATAFRARPANQRRLHYVDTSVQRPLLIAMVALEVVLVAASIWFAHWRLVGLIEESMYRMSPSQPGLTFARLAQEGFAVLSWFIVANLIALALVAAIWSYRENRVLREFAGLVEETCTLDFSGDAETPRRHEVLELAVAWRAAERARFAAIREQLGKLEADASAGGSAQDLRMSVERLSRLLP